MVNYLLVGSIITITFFTIIFIASMQPLVASHVKPTPYKFLNELNEVNNIVSDNDTAILFPYRNYLVLLQYDFLPFTLGPKPIDLKTFNINYISYSNPYAQRLYYLLFNYISDPQIFDNVVGKFGNIIIIEKNLTRFDNNRWTTFYLDNVAKIQQSGLKIFENSAIALYKYNTTGIFDIVPAEAIILSLKNTITADDIINVINSNKVILPYNNSTKYISNLVWLPNDHNLYLHIGNKLNIIDSSDNFARGEFSFQNKAVYEFEDLGIKYFEIYPLRTFFFTQEQKLIKYNFAIQQDDNYLIGLNYLICKKCGSLKLTIDNATSIILETTNIDNKFIWKYLGPFYLTKGKHELKIESINGFNAIEIFSIIKEDEYYEILNEILNEIRKKTTIYYFSKADLYGVHPDTKGSLSSKDGITLSNYGNINKNVTIIKEGMYKIGLKGKGLFKVIIDNKSFHFASNESNNIIYSPTFYLNRGNYTLKIEHLNINTSSNLPNPSFEEVSSDNLPLDWQFSNRNNFIISLDKGYSGKYSLKVSTMQKKEKLWSWIYSKPINVEPNNYYFISASMKLSNVSSSPIKLEIYEDGLWKQIMPFVVLEGGSFDWQKYNIIIKIPENITKIRFVLNSGWAINEDVEGITWFDDISIIKLSDISELDFVILHSFNEKDLTFNTKDYEKPAKIVSYHKINPTNLYVTVNVTKPFLLVYKENYDKFWTAYIYKDGKLIKTIKAVAVYGLLNGFWIDISGDNLEIVIKYTLQDYFEQGLIISFIVLSITILLFLYGLRAYPKIRPKKI